MRWRDTSPTRLPSFGTTPREVPPAPALQGGAVPRPGSDEPTQRAAYRQSLADVVATLGTDPRRGLSTGKARARDDRYGRNELTAEKSPPAWKRFLAQ